MASQAQISSSYIQDSNIEEKYRGLIKESFIRKIRNSLYNFYSYAYITANDFDIVHYVMSFWRLWQFMVPCLAANYPIWNISSFSGQLVNIITIIGQFIPVQSREIAALPFVIACIIVDFLLIIVVSIFGYILIAQAQLPHFVANVIVFLSTSLFLLIQYPCAQFVGETLGQWIMGTNHYSTAATAVCTILGIVAYHIYFFIVRNLISMSVMFRPFSLLTISHKTQTLFFSAGSIISLLCGIASQLDKIPRIILTVVMAILYFLCIFTEFYHGGLVRAIEGTAITATAASSCIMTIVIIVFDVLDQNGSELIVVALIFVWIISYFIASRIIINKKNNYIFVLDTILDNDEEFENIIKSVNYFFNVASFGFSIGHPICLNWSILQLASNRWPGNMDVWQLFLKFSVIYPEETYISNGVCKSITENHIDSNYARQTLAEMASILRTRESSLTLRLKEKLNAVVKHANSTKHKLRNVWDIVIQGNIAEMETAINNTHDSMQKVITGFNHLIRQYPNNRFITRSYSRFLFDVCADFKGFQKYDNDTKLLHRGIMANPDKAHSLGVKAFPGLPDNLSQKANGNGLSLLTSEDNNSSDIEDDGGISGEQLLSFTNIIEQLKFPSLSKLLIFRIILLIILFIFPIVFLMAYGSIETNKISDPMNYIYHIIDLSESLYLLTAFSQRILLETTNALPVSTIKGPGGFTNTKDQLDYLISYGSNEVTSLTDFETFNVGNKYMDESRAILMGNLYEYRRYTGEGQNVAITTTQMTLLSIANDLILQASDVLAGYETLTMYSPAVSTLIQSVYQTGDRLEASIPPIRQFISSKQKEVETVVYAIAFSFDAVSLIIWNVCISILLYMCIKEKEEVYKCLTTLQKNVISSVVDKLKLIKKNDGLSSQNTNTENDINKQDDNIIKVFATAGDNSSTSSSFKLINIITAIIELVLYLLGNSLFAYIMRNKGANIDKAAPQVVNLISSFSYECGITSAFMTLYGYKDLPNFSALPTLSNVDDKFVLAATSFTTLLFGNDDEGLEPFSIFIDEIRKYGSDNTAPHIQFMALSVIQNKNIIALEAGYDKDIQTSTVDTLWGIINNLYLTFFSPISEGLVQDVLDTLSVHVVPVAALCIVIIIILILIEIYVIRQNLLVQERLRFTLKLLLHCPPTVIQQSQRITAVLSGNFGMIKNDTTNRTNDYYLEIINNLPDAVIVTTKGLITTMNQAAIRYFGSFEENKDLPTLIGNKNQKLIDALENGKPNQPVKCQYTMKDNDVIDLDIAISHIGEDRIYTFKDDTQNVRYNQLIAAERSRSDMLLASILPPKLVPRVQAGEVDISFEVQSASVCFMDIVSFTPWCASLQADQVMFTLNRMFTEFDALINESATLTRVKCIGDCYMAAGGIFAELNQPEVHAKEMVQFGLDAISTIGRLNKELDQSLQIRVGVNTGGPLVAGVIGTGKPTFEIIGPVINMAQQMEHHGVPMQVHVSRAVYELIYGGTFNIKERGQIEIKNGKVVTYLVTNTCEI